MLHPKFVAAAALCIAGFLTAPQASAQEEADARPITFGFGGMKTLNVDSGLKGGWDLLGGAGFAVTRWSHHRDWRLYLTGNFLFEHLGVGADALQTTKSLNPGLQGAIGANARFYSATFDPTFRFCSKNRVSGYVLAGGGWLRRSIDFTSASSQGALLQPSLPSIVSKGASSSTVDGGGGVNVRLGGPSGPLLFGEARYLRGLSINRTTTLVPISIGIRW